MDDFFLFTVVMRGAVTGVSDFLPRNVRRLCNSTCTLAAGDYLDAEMIDCDGDTSFVWVGFFILTSLLKFERAIHPFISSYKISCFRNRVCKNHLKDCSFA